MKKNISIVGGGTAGLFLAAFLDTKKYEVTIYEKQKSLGRKFLVAGDGGFNLTHSEPIEDLKSRYTPTDFLEACLTHFTNEDLIGWLDQQVSLLESDYLYFGLHTGHPNYYSSVI